MADNMEERIIDKLAYYWGKVPGIKKAYGYAQNPDNIPSGDLPVVLSYPMQADYDVVGHHNVWQNLVRIRSSLYVVPRLAKGGKIRFIENQALPFPGRMRTMFQTKSVIQDLLSLGLQKAFIVQANYGAGGMYLTHMDIEYVGFTIDFQFQWTKSGAN
jgi:hypothetical protein